MDSTRQDDIERQHLIEFRTFLAAVQPKGILARIKHWDEMRRADFMLDYEDARRDGSDILAPQRRWTAIGIPGLLAAAAIRALFFSTHALTIGRAAWVLALCVGTVGALLGLASWSYRRQARQLERVYQAWLDRARALPSRDATKLLDHQQAAV